MNVNIQSLMARIFTAMFNTKTLYFIRKIYLYVSYGYHKDNVQRSVFLMEHAVFSVRNDLGLYT